MNSKVAAAVLSLFGVFALTAHTPIQPVNCDYTGKGVTLCREMKVLTQKQPFLLSRERYKNYEKRLRISADPNSGELIVLGQQRPKPLPKRWKVKDTAWAVRTAVLPIPAGDRIFSLCFRLSTNLVPSHIQPFFHKKTGVPSFRNVIYWYGKDGRKIAETLIDFAVSRDVPVENRIRGVIPAGTASADIEIGFDSPNMDENDFFRLSDFAFSTAKADASFYGNGSFLTDWIPKEDFGKSDVLKLTGELPAGSSAGIQAQDKNGAFCGPDGTEKSFYRSGEKLSPAHRNSPSLRFRISLKGNGKISPMVNSLIIGEKRLCFTSAQDLKAPVIRRISPSPAHDPSTPLQFTVTDENDLSMERFSAVLDGKDVTTRLRRKGTLFTYFPEKPFTMEVPHHITVSATDALGNKRVKKLFFIFYREFLKKGIVTMRKDGFILIDGKPFFPIGVTSVTPLPVNDYSYDKGIADLRVLGQNVFANHRHYYRKVTEQQILEMVRKHGMYYYTEASKNGHNANDLENIAENVSKEFRNPGLIGWYTGDDSSGHNTPEQMEDKHDAIKAMDPWHFTCQADIVGPRGARSNYRDYIHGNDVFRLELYPIHKVNPAEEREGVPGVIDDISRVREDIRLAGNPVKGVWGIVQYFRGWTEWKRFPTPEEVRCMNWLAVIHGANGIQWYTYNCYGKNNGVTHPEVWPHFQKLIREMASLQEIIVEEKPEQPAAPEYLAGETKDNYDRPSMNFLLKHHKGKSYLFTASAAAKEVQCRFSLPGYRKAKLLVEEKAEFSLDNGKLTAKYAPYGVHIWELEK